MLAILTGLRAAIAIVGALILATPVLLPRREHAAPTDLDLVEASA